MSKLKFESSPFTFVHHSSSQQIISRIKLILPPIKKHLSQFIKMHSFGAISVVALSMLGMAAAKPVPADDNAPTVVIKVEAATGGTVYKDDLIEVSFNKPITPKDFDILNAVSTLSVFGTNNIVPLDSITCVTLGTSDGTGSSGVPFTYGHPSYLSTNTVVVPSFVCRSPDVKA